MNALAGGVIQLTNLVNVDGSVTVVVDGTNSTVELPLLAAVTDTNGSHSFWAQNGGRLSLPSLRNYEKPGGGPNPTWQASGAGSLLAIAVTNVVSFWHYDLRVLALAGGRVYNKGELKAAQGPDVEGHWV